MRDIQNFPSLISLNDIPKNFFKKTKKILIIHSDTAKKNKIIIKLNSLLKNSKINYFNSSKLNFSSEIIQHKSQLFKPGYDLIIGVGGGNVIDISKIVYVRSIFLNWKKKIKEDSLILNKIKTKFMVISTLPGSGAEVSKTAVLNANNNKIFFTSNFFVPNYVFYDIKNISNLNKNILTIRLIDAIIHSIESQNSILKNSFSETCANYVVNNSPDFLKNIIKSKTKYFSYNEIKKLCFFSFYGGLAQSETGSGLCHALAHTLEKKFHFSHSESIFLCSLIALKYKRNNGINKKNLLIFKLINKLYSFCFTKKRISKHNSVLKKLNFDEFIINAKKDPCWKLDECRIEEDKISKEFKFKVKKKKWNI